RLTQRDQRTPQHDPSPSIGMHASLAGRVRWEHHDSQNRARAACARALFSIGLRIPTQQDTQLWLFFAPSDSRSAIVDGYGCTRWIGPFAMSTVVCPERAKSVTSAPCSTK